MTSLLEAYAGIAPAERRLLTETLPGVLGSLPDDDLPWPLEGVEANLARLAVLSGRQDTQQAAAALEPWLRRAAQQLDDRVRNGDGLDVETASFAISILASLLVLRAVGVQPPDLDPQPLLHAAADCELNTDYRSRGAFTALGSGLADLAAELIDGAPLPPAHASLLAEGGAALTDPGHADGLPAAWRGFLAALSESVATDPAAWSALVAVGRVVHVLVGGAAEDSVLDRIRAEVSG
jgi:hypothetical protein